MSYENSRFSPHMLFGTFQRLEVLTSTAENYIGESQIETRGVAQRCSIFSSFLRRVGAFSFILETLPQFVASAPQPAVAAWRHKTEHPNPPNHPCYHDNLNPK